MQVVGACMRKLVMIRYGVLKNRQPYIELTCAGRSVR
jgi:hypothetical protein